MAVELVGGALLSSTLQVVFDRLARREVVDYLRGKKLSDQLINNLKTVLSAVNSVLDDAAVKQNTNPNIKQWLDDLENASYDADDLLDEIETHALQSRLKAESTKSSKASKLFKHSISISVRSYDRDMKKKLEEILQRLKFLEERIYVLGLIKGVGEKPSPRPPTTSLTEESEVYGRDADKEAIIKLLLTHDDHEGRNKVSVIPIVGMGGIGKTTLAQSVYNDHAVEKHFNFKSWVCVSEEFDICKVTKTVLCAVTKSHSHSYDDSNLDLLQTTLKEGLTGKKFLIVLDDVWNEDYIDWKKMCTPFNYGAQGCKIIVTTRNEKVADITGTIPTHYHLEHLKDEDCWKLFEKHAFDKIRDSGVCQVLEKIGRGIAKKCNGLPLAAKSLGGLLRSKEDINEWERVLKSEIWDFPYKETKILPALLLSYNYLPSHLKRCFAFCSMFPKDYEFQKHELVLLWMAENLLRQSKRDKRMEDIGDEYFNELVLTSFFQRSSKVRESSWKYSFEVEKSFFVMHDLVHDLARYVSGEYCFTLEDGNSNEKAMRVRHLGVATVVSSQRFGTISESTHLRTLLPLDGYPFGYLFNEVVNNVILKLRCLRVLSLFGCTNLRQLSESIGELKHLRFLNLSETSIKRLPNSVCKLSNLQILNLSRCDELIELPEDMHHLINLRHLDISYCFNLVEMPRQLSKLKSLQTLTYFVVGKDNKTKIGELRELSDLHGELYLRNLQNVPSAEDALEAKLMHKNNLEALCLSWGGSSHDSNHDKEVLENLLPHTNLKMLYIYGYGGPSFPNWLGDVSFCNTVYIHLGDCKYCKCLPPLGQLPSLKTLYIVGLSGVVTVGAEFYGINGSSSARKAFASLKFLRFSNLAAWEEWCSVGVDDGEIFPKLQELEIVACDRLRSVDWPVNLPCLTKLQIICPSSGSEVLVSSLPRTPAIRHLDLGKCEQLEVRGLPQTVETISVGGCRGVESLMKALRESQTCSLQSLCINDCSLPISFPTGCLPATLTQLRINNCEKLEFPMHHDSLKTSLQGVSISKSCGGSLIFFPLDFFPSLNYLCFEECENLESLIVSDGLPYQHGLICLSSLRIERCFKFISFPNGGLHAPNLTHLTVRDCEKLKELPEQMAKLLPSLEVLWIADCPEVESFPEGGLPSNLCHLWIKNCSKLIAQRSKWNLQKLQALKYFVIVGGEGVESFPEEGLLPSTLTSLKMGGFASLKRLDIKELQQLTSLTFLEIKSCPELQNLPQQKLPSSLTTLHIYKCPILEERCQRDKGKDWNKISHIPGIYIDLKLI
nr:putative disease resistance protein At3g14460 isoform X1 [Ziziphus jujuba var. spinosa]XP_048318461.1 putative disease resistance protein At3g14460 isoform X1 [Ziziphus jujuba var. spinosa]